MKKKIQPKCDPISKNSVILFLEIDAEMRKQLKVLAEHDDRSLSSLARLALREFIERHRREL